MALDAKASLEAAARMALEARIKQLLAADENRKCADCGTRSPRWASYSLGIFVCLQCAGCHRSLGVHISRVKSCDLDVWTEDQVRAMESMGNGRGREEYGPSYAEVNNTTYLPDARSLDAFINSKYVSRLYAKGGFGASFNTPEGRAKKSAGGGGGGRTDTVDLWGDDPPAKQQQQPSIDTTSKIHIDWPRGKTAAAATEKCYDFPVQKHLSLIDLFEPAPAVVPQQQQLQQQPTAAPATNPFFADFAAAAPAAAAAPQPVFDPFALAAPAAAAPKLQPQQLKSSNPFAVLQQAQPQQQPRVLQKQAAAYDEDFGDFIGAAKSAAVAAPISLQHPVQQLQQQQQQSSLLFDSATDYENVAPILPAKDYDPFDMCPPALPARDYAPSASGADALAGLFAASTTLSPAAIVTAASVSVAAAAAPPPEAARMTTADILSLYSGGRGGAAAAAPSFVPKFGGGGHGASWA